MCHSGIEFTKKAERKKREHFLCWNMCCALTMRIDCQIQHFQGFQHPRQPVGSGCPVSKSRLGIPMMMGMMHVAGGACRHCCQQSVIWAPDYPFSHGNHEVHFHKLCADSQQSDHILSVNRQQKKHTNATRHGNQATPQVHMKIAKKACCSNRFPPLLGHQPLLVV